MHFKLYSNLMRSNSQISVNRDYSDCQTCSHNHHAPHLLHKKATGRWSMPTNKMPPNMQIVVPMCSACSDVAKFKYCKILAPQRFLFMLPFPSLYRLVFY